MSDARRRSQGSRTGLVRVSCLAVFACRHVRRVIGWLTGVLAAPLARHPARYLRSGRSPGV